MSGTDNRWFWQLVWVTTIPALQGITLFSEAFILDGRAPNSFFYQSNMLPITFQ